MSDASPAGRTAVRLPDSPAQRPALNRFIEASGLTDCVEFLPKDDDELNALACDGRFHRIVFANLDDLLTAVWKGDADWRSWRAAGVRIELADVPPHLAHDWLVFVDRMYANLDAWRRQARRRQIVAALILSVLALVAAAVLLFSANPN
jgi:hypothetical protein